MTGIEELFPLLLFGAFITFVITYGLEKANRSWLVPLATALSHPQGSFLTRVALKAVGAVIKGISFILRYVTHHLSVAASHSIAPFTAWVNGLAALVTNVALTGANFTAEVARGFERITTHTIPRAVHKAIAIPIHEVQIGLRHVERDLAQLRRYANGIDRLVTRRIWPAVRRIARAVDITLPRTIGRVRSRVGAAERAITSPSRAWIKRIWRAGWILVGAGLVLKFLVRKFPWLFCRNTTAAAKAVCGMDNLLLDALLLETVALTQAISVVNFAKALQALEGEAVHVMSLGIKELGDLEG